MIESSNCLERNDDRPTIGTFRNFSQPSNRRKGFGGGLSVDGSRYMIFIDISNYTPTNINVKIEKKEKTLRIFTNDLVIDKKYSLPTTAKLEEISYDFNNENEMSIIIPKLSIKEAVELRKKGGEEIQSTDTNEKMLKKYYKNENDNHLYETSSTSSTGKKEDNSLMTDSFDNTSILPSNLSTISEDPLSYEERPSDMEGRDSVRSKSLISNDDEEEELSASVNLKNEYYSVSENLEQINDENNDMNDIIISSDDETTVDIETNEKYVDSRQFVDFSSSTSSNLSTRNYNEEEEEEEEEHISNVVSNAEINVRNDSMNESKKNNNNYENNNNVNDTKSSSFTMSTQSEGENANKETSDVVTNQMGNMDRKDSETIYDEVPEDESSTKSLSFELKEADDEYSNNEMNLKEFQKNDETNDLIRSQKFNEIKESDIENNKENENNENYQSIDDSVKNNQIITDITGRSFEIFCGRKVASSTLTSSKQQFPGTSTPHISTTVDTMIVSSSLPTGTISQTTPIIVTSSQSLLSKSMTISPPNETIVTTSANTSEKDVVNGEKVTTNIGGLGMNINNNNCDAIAMSNQIINEKKKKNEKNTIDSYLMYNQRETKENEENHDDNTSNFLFGRRSMRLLRRDDPLKRREDVDDIISQYRLKYSQRFANNQLKNNEKSINNSVNVSINNETSVATEGYSYQSLKRKNFAPLSTTTNEFTSTKSVESSHIQKPNELHRNGEFRDWKSKYLNNPKYNSSISTSSSLTSQTKNENVLSFTTSTASGNLQEETSRDYSEIGHFTPVHSYSKSFSNAELLDDQLHAITPTSTLLSNLRKNLNDLQRDRLLKSVGRTATTRNIYKRPAMSTYRFDNKYSSSITLTTTPLSPSTIITSSSISSNSIMTTIDNKTNEISNPVFYINSKYKSPFDSTTQSITLSAIDSLSHRSNYTNSSPEQKLTIHPNKNYTDLNHERKKANTRQRPTFLDPKIFLKDKLSNNKPLTDIDNNNSGGRSSSLFNSRPITPLGPYSNFSHTIKAFMGTYTPINRQSNHSFDQTPVEDATKRFLSTKITREIPVREKQNHQQEPQPRPTDFPRSKSCGRILPLSTQKINIDKLTSEFASINKIDVDKSNKFDHNSNGHIPLETAPFSCLCVKEYNMDTIKMSIEPGRYLKVIAEAKTEDMNTSTRKRILMKKSHLYYQSKIPYGMAYQKLIANLKNEMLYVELANCHHTEFMSRYKDDNRFASKHYIPIEMNFILNNQRI